MNGSMPRTRPKAAVSWLLLTLTGVSLAQSDGAAWPFESTLEEFVVGNAQFVLLHELAHLVIDEKNVPVLGPEEAAADYIAAMMLIRPRGAPPPGDDRLLKVAVNTADAFSIAWQRQSELGQEIPYWAAHALTVQRFSTLACLLYGSDPDRFVQLPDMLDMPPVRAQGCRHEFLSASRAIDWLFDTFARREGEPPGAPMNVRIEPPPSRTSEHMLAAIEADGFIERTLERFHDFVALDEPASFVMRSCGQPQAAWIRDRRELVLCYELLDAYVLLGYERRGTTVGRADPRVKMPLLERLMDQEVTSTAAPLSRPDRRSASAELAASSG